MRPRTLLKAVLIASTVAVAAAVGGVLLKGEDYLWSSLRPDHAELLEGARVPSDVSARELERDVSFLLEELPERIPRFARVVDRAVLRAESDTVLAKRAETTRDGRALSLLRLLELPSVPSVGTGHAVVPPMQRPLSWAFYPFVAYLFDDGLWIVLGGEEANDATGWRIDEIGGRPTGEVLDAARPFVSADNASGRLGESARLLSYAGFLGGLGLTNADGSVVLGLSDPEGRHRELAVAPLRLFSWKGLRWGRTLQERVDAWSPADPRPRSRPFSLTYDEERRLLHVRVDRLRDGQAETLAAFGERVVRTAERRGVDRVLIDLRSNGGGDNQLVDGFVDRLAGHPAVDRRGVLYTAVGRRTFSAAGALAMALERRTRTLFAGEASGFTPNHLGDAVAVRLPGSDVIAHVPTRYWQDGGPYDRRAALAPDVPVPFESRDHFEGRDPLVETVLAHEPNPLPDATMTRPVRDALRAAASRRYRYSSDLALTLHAPTSGEGRFSITVEGADRWARSDLYAMDAEGVRFATDIDGVFLLRDGGDLAIERSGETRRLPPMGPDDRLPIARLRDGRTRPEAVAAGVEAFRRAAREGAVFDSRTELELNRLGYALLGDGRPEEALQVFELQAELFPAVPNAHDSLGEAYLAVGDSAGAAEAFTRALELDTTSGHARRMLEALAD